MSDPSNTPSGNLADEPQIRVADDALIAHLRNRTESTAGEEPLVLRLIRFTGADLQGVNLSHTEITGSVFDSADLTDARFVGARIEACSFIAAKLSRSVFTNAEFSLVNFLHADLKGADFRGATLDNVNVSDADLSMAVFGEGAAGTNFLEASIVLGMDITRIDGIDLEGADRLKLHTLGAIAHAGYRCPRCEQWDGAEYGIDPTCSLCDAVGFVDFDPKARRAELPLICPWCSGTGGLSYSMSSAGCLVCDGLGRLGTWVIDRSQYDDFVPSDVYEYEDGVRFVSMDFADIDFSEEWHEDGHIEDIVFVRCSFGDVSFAGALLRDIRFVDCDLHKAAFTRARLQEVTFSQCKLTNSDWTGASLDAVRAAACDFTHAVISPAQLKSIQNEGDSPGAALPAS